MILASFVILAYVAATVFISWLYFRRYPIARLPIGVFNLTDIAIMMGTVILVPFLYLFLPIWMVAGLLALASLSILYFTWEPVLRSVWAVWLVMILLASVDLITALVPGMNMAWFFAANNAIVVLCVAGVTNLWAQSGMKARDAAIFGAALAIYDLIATSFLPLMNDLFTRLEGLPFAPELAWQVNTAGDWIGIGLGDLVLLAVFPLVMRKAFSRAAGILALTIGLGAVSLLILCLNAGLFVRTFPVMIVLGPLLVLQYVYWKRKRKQERTSLKYLQVDPID